MTPTLNAWERKLYEAGYTAAVADAAQVVTSHAKKHMGSATLEGEILAGPLLDAGMEVLKLSNVIPCDLKEPQVSH